MSGQQAVATGSHILGIYKDPKQEMDECFSFLKAGFDNNEAIWIMLQALTPDQIRDCMRKDWNISNLKELEDKGYVTITSAREWYYPDGKYDANRIKLQWQRLVERALAGGKRGVRAFGGVGDIIKDGHLSEHIHYESELGTELRMPFIGLCAYQIRDIDRLKPDELSSLHVSHGLCHNLGFNALEDPLDKQHIVLVYETDHQRDLATAKYINEGLKRNQLCVYASVQVRDQAQIGRLISLVNDFDKHVEQGNLLVIDLAPYYIAAMTDNFAPFEQIRQQLEGAIADRENKQVRFVGDCVELLFKNKHFDECVRLESWWQDKPFDGSYLCPFDKRLLDTFPYDIHKFRIVANHDITADASGSIVAAYVSAGRQHK